jgi:hypothetical protein
MQNAEASPKCMTKAGPDTAPTCPGITEGDHAQTSNAAPEAKRHPPGDARDERGMPTYRGPYQIHAGMRS